MKALAVTGSRRPTTPALKDPYFVDREEALGAVVITDARLGGNEHKRFVEADIGKWRPTIKSAGQYAE